MLKKMISRHLVYMLLHAILALGGYIVFQRWDSPLGQAVGSSMLATGITGWIVFAYIYISDERSQRSEMIAKFGFMQAFENRGVRIKEEYDSRLTRAKRNIDIIGYGLKSLREDYADEFERWAQGAQVRILLIDPDFPSATKSFASQRDTEEGNPVGTIKTDVKQFVRSTARLKTSHPGRFTVRLYRCIPCINIFRVDDEIFWGPYFVGHQSRNAPTFLVKRGGVMFSRLMDHFDEIWNKDELSRQVPDEWLQGS